ncbi:MAG: glycosyltransferase family 4 protein [Flavobacteriales bacterium]|nr:glycosyltransferase family 4 protein [Flavobacteriales bacterium]
MKLKIGYDAKRLFNNRSGLGNYSRTLVRDILSRHTNDVCYLFTPKRSVEVDFLPSTQCRVVMPRGGWKLLKSLWRTVRIAPKCRKEKINVFHGLSHELPYGIEKMGVKTVLTVHDLIFMRHPEFYNRTDVKIHTKKIRYAVQVADVIIAISNQTKVDIMELLGVEEEKIRVVYQGITRHSLYDMSLKEAEEELKSFLLPTKYILCVGTMEERKNQLKLCQALKNIPEAHLVIVGRSSGGYGQMLHRYIRENDIADRVKIFSDVTDSQLSAFYKKCLYVVYPSVYEGFGLPIVEAMAYGKPVLTTRGGCFEEAGGRAAWYMDSSDVNDIARCIRRLWADGFARDILRENAREQLKKFSAENTSEKIYEIYRSLVEGKEEIDAQNDEKE